MVGFKYSGGGVTLMQLAMIDVLERPFPDILRNLVLDPIGMDDSFFDQPLSPEQDARAARGHIGQGEAMAAKYHIYPELAAAGMWTTAVDLAKFAIEVQLSLQGRANHVLSQEMVREMVRPVGVGDFAVGFELSKEGDGWYFSHTGGNRGFRCLLTAHVAKGYGCAVMTNGGNGGLLMREVKERIERAYNWDSLAKPIPR